MYTARVSSRRLIRTQPGSLSTSLFKFDRSSIESNKTFLCHSRRRPITLRFMDIWCYSPLWTYQQSPSALAFSTSTLDAASHHSPSNRSKFKEIPVNPSILSYIESIGIGIQKRNPAKRRLNRLRKNKSGRERQNKGKFLTREEEIESLPNIRRMPSRIPPPPFAMPQSKSMKNMSVEIEHRSTSKKPINDRKRITSNSKNTTTTKHKSHDHQGNKQPEIQRSIRRYPVTCIASIGTAEDSFPPGSLKVPEVAIAGRSNVGKSTLLNALLYGNHPSRASQESQEDVPFRQRRRQSPKRTSRTAKLPKGLKAATSSKPGQTRTIDFYRLTAKVITSSRNTISHNTEKKNTDASEEDDASRLEETTRKISLQLVDLPGYGFAYATDDKMEAWKSLMQDYILNRGKPLKRILLLIDARHGMKIADIEFMESLQEALLTKKNKHDETSSQNQSATKKRRELPPIQIVLTKCDLVSQVDLARRVVQAQQQLSDCLIRQPSALPVMLVSAQIEGQRGVLELQKELASLVPGSK